MRLFKRVLALVLLALVLFTGLLFSIQNTALVPLDLLVVKLPEQRVALWVLGAFAVGGIVGMAIGSYTVFYLKSELILLRRKLAKYQNKTVKPPASAAHLPATKS